MNYLVGHLVGDYLWQNDWMAAGKKRKHWICLVHVLCYTSAVMLCTQWPLWTIPIVAVPHFLIDRWGFVKWWMDHAGQKDFRRVSCVDMTWHPSRDGRLTSFSYSVGLGPWSLIVVDNVMHIVCLWGTQQVVDWSSL